MPQPWNGDLKDASYIPSAAADSNLSFRVSVALFHCLYILQLLNVHNTLS